MLRWRAWRKSLKLLLPCTLRLADSIEMWIDVTYDLND